MQVQFGQAYRLNQVTVNGQEPSMAERIDFFGYPGVVLRACADRLEINREPKQTEAILRTHQQITGDNLDTSVHRELILTREDAVLLSLVSRIGRLARRPGHANAEVDFTAPAFRKQVEELRGYGVDAAAHFREKGLITYQDFDIVEAESQRILQEIPANGCALVLDKPSHPGKQGLRQHLADPWMDALKKILKADPTQPTPIDVDFERTPRGGFQVKKLDVLNA